MLIAVSECSIGPIEHHSNEKLMYTFWIKHRSD
jgi:hypothetical protein